MADTIQDKNNPNIWREGNITIIKIPELGENAEMRFNFDLSDKGINDSQKQGLANDVEPKSA